jgi:hypothetical protein
MATMLAPGRCRLFLPRRRADSRFHRVEISTRRQSRRELRNQAARRLSAPAACDHAAKGQSGMAEPGREAMRETGPSQVILGLFKKKGHSTLFLLLSD